jgi:hypothetical protein
MQIKQVADCSISIRRFDNGKQVDFIKNTIINLDKQTAEYLLQLKIYSDNGFLQTDFVEVV